VNSARLIGHCATALSSRKVGQDDRDELVESLAVAVFQNWYFTAPDSRRVERRLEEPRRPRCLTHSLLMPATSVGYEYSLSQKEADISFDVGFGFAF